MDIIPSLKSLMLACMATLLIVGCRTETPTSTESSNFYVHTSQDPDRLNPVLYPLSYARIMQQ